MLKVVVVDNNAISRDLLSTILLNGGHDVVGGSNNSPAGLAKVIKLHPQIVCIDIGSADSESDGMAMLETLRAELPKVLLFLVSGKISEETIQNAQRHGVHGFIVKPFNAVTVLATIRNSIIALARKHRSSADGTS
jgi:two-component system, chemotaxis family, chemotaxis protein CheY